MIEITEEMVCRDRLHPEIECVGKWAEGEKIQVCDRERRVNYDEEAGDLYITFRGKKYFFSEMDFYRKEKE